MYSCICLSANIFVHLYSSCHSPHSAWYCLTWFSNRSIRQAAPAFCLEFTMSIPQWDDAILFQGLLSCALQDLLRIGGLLFGDPVAISNGEGGSVRLPGLRAQLHNQVLQVCEFEDVSRWWTVKEGWSAVIFPEATQNTLVEKQDHCVTSATQVVDACRCCFFYNLREWNIGWYLADGDLDSERMILDGDPSSSAVTRLVRAWRALL